MDFDAAGFGFEDEASPCASDAEGEDGDELEVATVTKTSVCFFSVGFDASIAMQFTSFASELRVARTA
jgi:diacylglycerol kinase (ATP)